MSFLLTRFKGAGEESHGRRGAGARAARVFSRLSDDKEGGGGGGGGPPRFPTRGYRTIIFPLPSGDIALFPSIKCPPSSLYAPLSITVIEETSWQIFEIRKFIRNSSFSKESRRSMPIIDDGGEIRIFGTYRWMVISIYKSYAVE